MMQKLIDLLNKKYPISSKINHSLTLILLVGFFVGSFLFFFKPFGLQNVTGDAFYLWGYGIVSILVLSFNLLFLKNLFVQIFNEEKWTVLKNILWLLWIVSTIGLGNLFYSKILFYNFQLTAKQLFVFQFYTVVIAIIPVIVITLVTQNKYLKNNIKNALKISESLTKSNIEKASDKIKFSSENDKDQIELFVKDVLFLEASGNYVEINYLEENKHKVFLIRSSLKRITLQTENFLELFKSHRSFIININNVLQVKGNAQGYQLSMKNTEKTAPVSRSFIKDFKQIFK